MKCKPIENYEHLLIYENGEIYNTKTHRYLKGSYTRGYKYVHLSKNKMYQVHRLVAKAFIPNPLGKEEINHINGIRNDNRVENLEWVSHLENMQDANKKRGKNKKGALGIQGITMKSQYAKFRSFYKNKSKYANTFCGALENLKELKGANI